MTTLFAGVAGAVPVVKKSAMGAAFCAAPGHVDNPIATHTVFSTFSL